MPALSPNDGLSHRLRLPDVADTVSTPSLGDERDAIGAMV
jgi:hypothetical protein